MKGALPIKSGRFSMQWCPAWRGLKSTLPATKIHVPGNRRPGGGRDLHWLMHYACAIRSREANFIPKRVVVLRLNDTIARFCPGARPEQDSRSGAATHVNSRRCDSRRHNIFGWYHVNEYRATRGNRSELARVWKPPRYHVNTPLEQIMVQFGN